MPGSAASCSRATDELAPPVGILGQRAGQVRLLGDAERVLELRDHDPGGRPREHAMQRQDHAPRQVRRRLLRIELRRQQPLAGEQAQEPGPQLARVRRARARREQARRTGRAARAPSMSRPSQKPRERRQVVGADRGEAGLGIAAGRRKRAGSSARSRARGSRATRPRSGSRESLRARCRGPRRRPRSRWRWDSSATRPSRSDKRIAHIGARQVALGRQPEPAPAGPARDRCGARRRDACSAAAARRRARRPRARSAWGMSGARPQSCPWG